MNQCLGIPQTQNHKLRWKVLSPRWTEAFSGSWSCCRSLNTTRSKERLLKKGFILVIYCKLPQQMHATAVYMLSYMSGQQKKQENNWQLWKQGYLYGHSRYRFLCNQSIPYKKVPNVKDFKGSCMNLPACLSPYRRLAVTLVTFKGEGASELHLSISEWGASNSGIFGTMPVACITGRSGHGRAQWVGAVLKYANGSFDRSERPDRPVLFYYRKSRWFIASGYKSSSSPMETHVFRSFFGSLYFVMCFVTMIRVLACFGSKGSFDLTIIVLSYKLFSLTLCVVFEFELCQGAIFSGVHPQLPSFHQRHCWRSGLSWPVEDVGPARVRGTQYQLVSNAEVRSAAGGYSL